MSGETNIKAVRHKNGNWSLYVTYPDGSYERRTQLKGWDAASRAAHLAVIRASRIMDEAAARAGKDNT